MFTDFKETGRRREGWRREREREREKGSERERKEETLM